MKLLSKPNNSQTIIAEDVSIDGDISLKGNVTIYGEIRGSVVTDGAIQLSKNGKIFTRFRVNEETDITCEQIR